MFPKISALDNEWNRRAGFTSESTYGFVMDEKNGILYFARTHGPEDTRFYKCEEAVFRKNFKVLKEIVTYDFDPFDNLTFVRYPLPAPVVSPGNPEQ